MRVLDGELRKRESQRKRETVQEKRRCRQADPFAPIRISRFRRLSRFRSSLSFPGLERRFSVSEPIRSLVIIVGVLAVTLTIAAGLIWLERRLLALWQDRYGPNRVGPFGLLQVVADMVKIFTKEDWIPPFADKPIFVLAPAVIVVTVLLSFAVVPLAPGIVVANLNVGLLFFLAMSSMGVYSVVLGGWASDN